MKVYLDDLRPVPEGWTGVRWPEEAIELLKTGRVEALSLDHDLGDDLRDGYQVLTWLERAVAVHGFKPPAVIRVHSDNSAARLRMLQAITKIRDYAEAAAWDKLTSQDRNAILTEEE